MKLLAALLLVILTGGSALASKSCPTRGEAKAMYRGAYLYWYTDAVGARCYSNRRVKSYPRSLRRRHYAEADERPTPPPAAPQPVLLPAELMPTHLAVPPQPRTILDSPSWRWVTEARAAFAAASQDDREEPFSSFAPGQEPDVWPKLDPPQANAAGLIIIIFAGLFAMGFGAVLARWHLSRLRMTR